jgi:hypothetical protein
MVPSAENPDCEGQVDGGKPSENFENGAERFLALQKDRVHKLVEVGYQWTSR